MWNEPEAKKEEKKEKKKKEGKTNKDPRKQVLISWCLWFSSTFFCSPDARMNEGPCSFRILE
jgi:hypothetical protein